MLLELLANSLTLCLTNYTVPAGEHLHPGEKQGHLRARCLSVLGQSHITLRICEQEEDPNRGFHVQLAFLLFTLLYFFQTPNLPFSLSKPVIGAWENE